MADVENHLHRLDAVQSVRAWDGDGGGQRAAIRDRLLGRRGCRHRQAVGRGLLGVPNFGQTHGSARVHQAKAQVTRGVHAAPVPPRGPVLLPCRVRARTGRGERQDLLNVAVAQIGVGLQHQSHDARHRGRGKRRAGHHHRVAGNIATRTCAIRARHRSARSRDQNGRSPVENDATLPLESVAATVMTPSSFLKLWWLVLSPVSRALPAEVTNTVPKPSRPWASPVSMAAAIGAHKDEA